MRSQLVLVQQLRVQIYAEDPCERNHFLYNFRMACPVNDERITLAGLLIEANAGLTAELGKRLERDCGLSVQWFEVMLRLVRTPGAQLTMSELASQSTVTLSGLTRVIDRLEEAGYVRREACPTDRRVSYATLTAAGKRKIEEAVPKHIE